MFLLEIKPWKSSNWSPPKNEELITADKLRLQSGARHISKKQEAGGAEAEQQENASSSGQEGLPDVPIVSGAQHHMGSGVRGDSYIGGK